MSSFARCILRLFMYLTGDVPVNIKEISEKNLETKQLVSWDMFHMLYHIRYTKIINY